MDKAIRTRYERAKTRVFQIVARSEKGDLASALFEILIVALIVMSVVCIVWQSYEASAIQFASFFYWTELVSSIVFTIEYALRLWVADRVFPTARFPRLKYAFSFLAIVDLAAFLPFYLPFLGIDARFLRIFRLFRLFRIAKLSRYFSAVQTIKRVIVESAYQLTISFFACFAVMLTAAIVMFEIERDAQPGAFPNIPSTLWWAACTLTTVGYGDVYPITALGKIAAAIISIVGIGVIALPTGVIAAGFSRAMLETRDAERARDASDARSDDDESRKKFCPYCGKRLED